jgi:hypothetical protein
MLDRTTQSCFWARSEIDSHRCKCAKCLKIIVFRLRYLGFILKMDVAYISEKLVLNYHTTAQWNNLEYQGLNLYLSENMKSCGNGQLLLKSRFQEEMLTG